MPTTIRVEEPVKAELDRLQGDFLAGRGERLSHSEVLRRLLHLARRHEEELLGEADEYRPTPEDIERLISRIPDVGVRTNARHYKDELYAERP